MFMHSYITAYLNGEPGLVEDVVRSFGFLTLGSRMKRIGEKLQADTQKIMDELGAPLQASQYPFLAAIDRHPMALNTTVSPGHEGISMTYKKR